MLDSITDVDRLQRINRALMNRVESQLDQQGNSFSLFQTALSLEGQVKRRTDELTSAMHRLENINDELAIAKEAAEIANQSKTSFLAAASHDVLQPLNAALLSISVLADLQNTESGKLLVSQVERSLENMNALLGTLLDISRLEAGVLRPIRETIRLDVVFESLEADFGPLAHQMGLHLLFPTTHASVVSDRTMLRRILQNLISNALRYTSKGGVNVEVSDADRNIEIKIRDTGQGISEELQQSVFEEFNRGDAAGKSVEGYVGGFGLGLSIVQKMISSLGHELTMQSKVAHGTEFTIRIPRSDSVTTDPEGLVLKPAHKTAQADLAGSKILLLENDPSVIEAMKTLMKSWNCEVAIATTSSEAIEAINDTDWIPDFIIADQHLNQGDLGTVTVEEVWNYLGQKTPAMIVSADPTDALESVAATMGLELMVKPVKPAAFRAIITHLISA